MLGHLWLWLARWASNKGLTGISDTCLRIAGEGRGATGVEALFRFGQSLNAREDFEDAAKALEDAVSMAPAHARAWCALGVSRRQLADMPAARAAYERALAIDPDYPDAQVNLGEWHLVSGDAATALSCFDRVLARNPGHYEALTNKTAALIEAGRHTEAEDVALEALRLFPLGAPLHVNLGNVYAAMAKGREAADAYRKALEFDPESEEAALSLATLLGSQELLARAIEFLKKQILVRGESPDRLCRLAMAQVGQKEYGDAEETCRRVLEKHPEHIAALVTLSNAVGALGNSEEAMAITKRVVALRPDLSSIHSNILFEATHSEKLTRREVFDLHLEWAAQHEAPLLEKHLCKRLPSISEGLAESRRIRIGYVSGDFVSHPVGFLIRDILRDHDKRRFETWCYSQVTFPEHVTAQIKSYADHWDDCFFLSDEQLAERIVEDKIDILVDLSGHTARNRLRVFAMRPAPVQVAWIGYFHSTGLSSIDYFITDPYSTPPNDGQLFSEQPVYLPHSRFCFSPPTYAPAVGDLPRDRNGFITFGSFNRLSKLTPAVVQAWAAILTALPESRLLLKTAGLQEEEGRDVIREQFSKHGVKSDRLDLRGSSSHQEMFDQYSEVDIGLDPFPFNGGMTTLETLWMGIPVVALRGNSVVSLQSTSLLMNVGLAELIFDDTRAYIAGALALACDHEHLRQLRREMRPRMSKSAICQPEVFTHELEFLYSRMWRAWNEQRKLGMEVVSAPPESKRKVLHVGCGGADRRSMPKYFQGRAWQEIRLDIDPNVLPDVVASMLDMSPVEDASVDAVYSSHNIEHLHPHEVPIALKEFRRVLKADGLLALTCPDIQSVCALVVEDKLDEPAYISPAGPIAPLDMLYGHRASMAGGNLYMAHKTGFTATTLKKSLIEGGFESCTIRRGTNFDLVAVAYPVASSAERIKSDMSSCWPVDTQA